MTVTGIYCPLLLLDILVTDVYSVIDMLLCQSCVPVGHMQFAHECVHCAYHNTCWWFVCCSISHCHAILPQCKVTRLIVTGRK